MIAYLYLDKSADKDLLMHWKNCGGGSRAMDMFAQCCQLSLLESRRIPYDCLTSYDNEIDYTKKKVVIEPDFEPVVGCYWKGLPRGEKYYYFLARVRHGYRLLAERGQIDPFNPAGEISNGGKELCHPEEKKTYFKSEQDGEEISRPDTDKTHDEALGTVAEQDKGAAPGEVKIATPDVKSIFDDDLDRRHEWSHQDLYSNDDDGDGYDFGDDDFFDESGGTWGDGDLFNKN